jgi:hypothetical protein
MLSPFFNAGTQDIREIKSNNHYIQIIAKKVPKEDEVIFLNRTT